MSKITSPISVLELGSTYLHFAIYDKSILNQYRFYQEKIDYTKNEKTSNEKLIIETIIKAEKDIGQHLNEITLLIDPKSTHTLDISIKKNYEKKIINRSDINYLKNESENIIKLNNKDKDILHAIITNIFFDGVAVNEIEKVSSETSSVVIEFKFIMANKKEIENLKSFFFSKHISVNNVYCTSYIKCLGLIGKLNISGYSSFIDIGLNKSSILIFEDDKLLYSNNIRIGGNHVTKDIVNVLKIDYRNAEEQKFEFSKKKVENNEENDDLLKQIINSRLEEIIELLFFNSPFFKNKFFSNNLKLFFIGNGSKALNENLLSFGSEFDFISDMSIINEENKDTCNSAIKFSTDNEKVNLLKSINNLENKGFFEKFFDYFSQK